MSAERFKPKPVIVSVATEDFGTVHIRALTAAQYLSAPNETFAVSLVAMSLCEADGTPIKVDESDIAGWPMRSFEPIAEQVMTLNGLEKKVNSANQKHSPTPLPNGSAEPTLSGSLAS